MAKTHCPVATKFTHTENFLPYTYHHHGPYKKYAQPYWKQDFYFTHAQTAIYVIFSQGCEKWGNGRLDKVGKNQIMAET